MIDEFFRGDFAAVPTNVPAMILGLLLAFAGGHVIGWVYMFTHTGLSYSRSFVNSLVIMLLSNNLVTAFGLMAVFAIVRFRNILRDTLDTTYVLCVIVIGMAAGTMKFATAIFGCLLLSAILFYLWFTSFGTRHRYDTIINLHWSRPLGDLVDLRLLLQRHSRKAICASQRSHEGYEGTDLSYRLLMRDPDRLDDMLTERRGMQGVSLVAGLEGEEESEI